MTGTLLTTDTFFLIILVVTALTAILVFAAIVRISTGFRAVAGEMRDAFRVGREETRSAGKELREELFVGLKSTNDTIYKTLDGLGRTHQTKLEEMTKQLKELAGSNQNALDRIRVSWDARVKDLQENNEKVLQEMRRHVSDDLKTTGDSISKTLDDLGKAQLAQFEEMKKQIEELNESGQDAWDLIQKPLISYTDSLDSNDFVKLHAMLAQTYWAGNRTFEDMVDAAANSVFVAARDETGELIGFARAVTDRVTFSWICDVVVDPALRGTGIGKELVSRLLRHQHVNRTRKILVTKDARDLYVKFGFQTHPFECMICSENKPGQDSAPGDPPDGGSDQDRF